MEKKIKVVTANLLLIIMLLVLSVSLAIGNVGIVANADTADIEENQDIEPYGIMARLSIQLGSEDGSVWAMARNDFTLGNSIIEVYVELYSSSTYKNSYRDMVFESSEHIDDLNIYKTITTTAPINGEERYWRGRLHYRMDNKDWISKETATYFIDANGQILE